MGIRYGGQGLQRKAGKENENHGGTSLGQARDLGQGRLQGVSGFRAIVQTASGLCPSFSQLNLGMLLSLGFQGDNHAETRFLSLNFSNVL